MKASEFIKKYGWDYAIHAGSEDAPLYINLDYKDLEKYINAYELVESYGGIDEAPYEVYLETGDDCYYNKELEEAIKLVEECL